MTSMGRAGARRTRTAWLVAPALVTLLGLFAYPLARMLLLSLFDPTFTLKHYAAFVRVSAYGLVLFNTFQLAFTVTLVCLLLGYPVAYLLVATPPRLRALLVIPIILPFMISPLVRTYAWMVLLGRAGLVNEVLLSLGVVSAPLPLVHNTIGVHVGMVQILLPFMVLPLYSVMAGIDPRLVRAAYNLGAPPWRAFWRIFLPLSLPGVMAGSSLVFIVALGFFITPALLGGLHDMTLSMLIEHQVGDALNWGFASALAVILLGATLALVLLLGRFLGFERIWGERT